MADITAKAVSDLRAKTGVGMMECKKALTEANGNIDEAIKILREKGMAVAAKKADRIAADGIVDILFDKETETSIIIEVNTETDFVAKNEDFQKFVKGCLNTILNTKPASVEALLAEKFDGTNETVDEALKEKILVIGEKITIRRFDVTKGSQSTYIHGKGTIGVVVLFDADDTAKSNEGYSEFTKNIALQIAALTPTYLRKEDVPADIIESEREILTNQIKNDPDNNKKPENIIARMVEGRIKKFYDTNCVLEQIYVKDDKITVGQYVADYAKQVGGNVSVVKYIRYEKGEGIQKREENFAEEIAKLTNG